MDGIGEVSANGGYGNGTSGGGSAGRISIVTDVINEFTDEGVFSNAGGGGGSTYQAGGGGTVYLQVSVMHMFVESNDVHSKRQ